MIASPHTVVCFLSLLTSSCDAFQSPLSMLSSSSTWTRKGSLEKVAMARPTSNLRMSDSEDTSARKRKRRRRKGVAAADSSPEEAAEAPPPELKPRPEGGVGLEVIDVRELTGIGQVEPVPDKENPLTAFLDGIKDDAPTTPSPAGDALGPDSFGSGADSNDAMAQLLADAKAMQADEKELSSDKESSGTMDTVRNVISTIITVDFFFVCILLLWFLAGIFCSSVLKDDTVQIAFNSNFQMVAQPALGVLMIGSAAGALSKDEDENDGQ